MASYYEDDYSYTVGTVEDNVFTVWRYDGRKEDGINFTYDELNKVVRLSANTDYALYEFVKIKDFAGVEKRIMESSDPESYRKSWEEDIEYGKYSALEKRILDSMCRTIKELYEMEYGEKLINS